MPTHYVSQSDQSLTFFIQYMNIEQKVNTQAMHVVFHWLCESLGKMPLVTALQQPQANGMPVAVLLLQTWVANFKSALYKTKHSKRKRERHGEVTLNFSALAPHWQYFWALLKQTVVKQTGVERLVDFQHAIIFMPFDQPVAPSIYAASFRSCSAATQRPFQKFIENKSLQLPTLNPLDVAGVLASLQAWYQQHEAAIKQQLLMNKEGYISMLNDLHKSMKQYIRGRGKVKHMGIALKNGVKGKRSESASIKTQLRETRERLEQQTSLLTTEQRVGLDKLIAQVKAKIQRHDAGRQPKVEKTMLQQIVCQPALTYACMDQQKIKILQASPKRDALDQSPLAGSRVTLRAPSSQLIAYEGGSAFEFIAWLVEPRFSDDIEKFKLGDLVIRCRQWKHFYSLMDVLLDLPVKDLEAIYRMDTGRNNYQASAFKKFSVSLVESRENFNQPLSDFTDLPRLVDELKTYSEVIKKQLTSSVAAIMK